MIISFVYCTAFFENLQQFCATMEEFAQKCSHIYYCIRREKHYNYYVSRKFSEKIIKRRHIRVKEKEKEEQHCGKKEQRCK